MCTHDTVSSTPRHGYRLEDGHDAHSQDHSTWSRRGFLASLGLSALGGAFMLRGTPVQAFGNSRLLARLGNAETDRALVLIRLAGGNDGLNTIVPVENDLYYQARPRLAIAKQDTLRLSDTLGMHTALAPLEARYSDGHMAILQNVGYPSPSLSHFRSTDIWLSGSFEDRQDMTGWVGRYLHEQHPNVETDPLDFPLAVQIGNTSSLLFEGPEALMGMSVANTKVSERLIKQGAFYDVDAVPATTYGHEMAFLRDVANDTYQYAASIRAAASRAENRVEYPNHGLARKLAGVARLIKGQLGARIYSVTLGGFDTHANQLWRHNNLLTQLSTSVAAFLDDLAADGWLDKTVVMTFSEFGRRVSENGSRGTDHGTAAPLFLFGAGLQGGLYGQAPNLTDLDRSGNLAFDLDFRAVYATLLQNWFGLSAPMVSSLMGASFETIPFLQGMGASGRAVASAAPLARQTTTLPTQTTLFANYPNPFNPSTTIRYALAEAGPVRLQVYDVQGRVVARLADGHHEAGTYTVHFDAQGLPSGSYFYRIETPHHVQTLRMSLVK